MHITYSTFHITYSTHCLKNHEPNVGKKLYYIQLGTSVIEYKNNIFEKFHGRTCSKKSEHDPKPVSKDTDWNLLYVIYWVYKGVWFYQIDQSNFNKTFSPLSCSPMLWFSITNANTKFPTYKYSKIKLKEFIVRFYQVSKVPIPSHIYRFFRYTKSSLVLKLPKPAKKFAFG